MLIGLDHLVGGVGWSLFIGVVDRLRLKGASAIGCVPSGFLFVTN